MKIPFLNIWVTGGNWKQLYFDTKHISDSQYVTLRELRKLFEEQSETYIDKQGRLRYQHNGKFAPDNRSKFKRLHDQLRSEVNKPIDYDAVKQASKIEEFGR